MGNQNQNKNKNPGSLGRLAQENAQKNTEFGKMGDQPEKNPNIIHEEPSKNKHTGIDRGRWAD